MVAVMNVLDRLGFFEPLDAIAVALIVVAWFVIGFAIENPRAARPSVSVLMARHRREWLRQHVTRDPRVFDALLVANLRQGTSFFASACLVAIGGGLALIGNPERLATVARDLTLEDAPAVVWDVRVLLVLIFLANGLFKFVWAHRLFGYTAVLMGSIPNEVSDLAYARATQAGEISVSAARSFNRGLRAIYFALGALAWLLGPEALIGATVITVAILWRREFASHSRVVLLQAKEES